MAKKNSSKTATEKAIQSSEPRVINYRSWQGVNFVDAPLTWEPLESGPGKFRETDLPTNYLMVQNNLVTTDTLSLETRMDSSIIGVAPDLYEFTGVAVCYKRWLFAAARTVSADPWYEVILYRDLVDGTPDTWEIIRLGESGRMVTMHEINEMGFFESNLVVTTRDYNTEPDTGVLFLGMVTTTDTTIQITGTNWMGGTPANNFVTDTPAIANPNFPVGATAHGLPISDELTTECPVRINVCFCYTNRLGSTLTNATVSNANITEFYTECDPSMWTTSRYIEIMSGPEGTVDTNIVPGSSIRGIDFYGRDTENLDWVFIGHIDVTPAPGGVRWTYNWYGNMSDTAQWATSQLQVPTDNSTRGPNATYFSYHDSRIYYWGMPTKPYRLWIGGNPGAEFSVARGLGGAWVDIEPGSGYDVMGTAKWKTTSGANIVTIMCGNRNTTKVKRFNLVETNLTLTNEVAYKSYMYEEVSNVVGCNSRWGYGVFTEGLYSISRYGLMLTTMAMEYNSQMKNESVSDVIQPIFTNVLGSQLRDGRMVCIDEIIYIVFSEEDTGYLGNVILCYDTKLKAWYTWTHDETLVEDGDDGDQIIHIFAVDSDEHVEGLGVVTKRYIRLYPVTGTQDPVKPDFQVLMETGELIPRMPKAATSWIEQFEFRFDYFVSDPEDPPTVLIEGVDYYGRFFFIEKTLNVKTRDWQTVNDNGLGVFERRNYIEHVRIGRLCESLRIRIKGRARFRLTHINCKMYQQADVIGTPYGWDALDRHRTYHGKTERIHHHIDDYNNLRRAVVT